MHPRKRTYGYSTRNEHMPEAHRQHATWTPERLLEWAGHIGSETHSYVLHIRLSGIKSILEKGLDKQPVQDPKPDLLSTMEHENVRGSEYYH